MPDIAEDRNRFDLRVHPADRALIVAAARIAGMSVNKFVVTAAIEKAEQVIRNGHTEE